MEIKIYSTETGKEPFTEWLENLNDLKAKGKIRARLNRVRLGNLSDFKAVGEGVFELRINFGPGYRVYFGRMGKKLVIILAGGDKSSQNRDIQKAKQYWLEYLTCYEKEKVQKISRRTH